MPEQLPLTITDLLAAATSNLLDAGYKRVERLEISELNNSNTRVFEDVYNIVAIAAYNTWTELDDNWKDTQAALVELISQYLERSDAKAWDGYLVLITPSILNQEEIAHLINIRYNTSHLRKLVAAGNELTVLQDVKRILAPLLPLQVDPLPVERRSVLDELPSLLTARGISSPAVKAVVDAYQDQKPLVEALHKFREQQ
jgi:hypothetical protein